MVATRRKAIYSARRCQGMRFLGLSKRLGFFQDRWLVVYAGFSGLKPKRESRNISAMASTLQVVGVPVKSVKKGGVLIPAFFLSRET
jgi:hypothetical protein